jgi:hypothetical protein
MKSLINNITAINDLSRIDFIILSIGYYTIAALLVYPIADFLLNNIK